MRGVVFTELIEFVEDKLGFDIADKMIEEAKLDNEGVFTQGGNYPFEEMVKLLTSLSKITGKEPNELLEIFGEHLFSVLVKIYGKDIKENKTALSFIDSVEDYVHVEVKKLYPDAELPTFTTTYKDDNKIVIIYQSDKKLDSFAQGLIKACGEYFNENLDISKEIVSKEPYQVEFTIIKK